VRGTASSVGTWPAAFDAQPANRRVVRQGTSGDGKVLDDNSAEIEQAIAAYGKTVPRPESHVGGCSFKGAPRGSGWLLALLGASLLWRRERVGRGARS
jgi:hypothetical protein